MSGRVGDLSPKQAEALEQVNYPHMCAITSNNLIITKTAVIKNNLGFVLFFCQVMSVSMPVTVVELHIGFKD